MAERRSRPKEPGEDVDEPRPKIRVISASLLMRNQNEPGPSTSNPFIPFGASSFMPAGPSHMMPLDAAGCSTSAGSGNDMQLLDLVEVNSSNDEAEEPVPVQRLPLESPGLEYYSDHESQYHEQSDLPSEDPTHHIDVYCLDLAKQFDALPEHQKIPLMEEINEILDVIDRKQRAQDSRRAAAM